MHAIKQARVLAFFHSADRQLGWSSKLGLTWISNRNLNGRNSLVYKHIRTTRELVSYRIHFQPHLRLRYSTSLVLHSSLCVFIHWITTDLHRYISMVAWASWVFHSISDPSFIFENWSWTPLRSFTVTINAYLLLALPWTTTSTSLRHITLSAHVVRRDNRVLPSIYPSSGKFRWDSNQKLSVNGCPAIAYRRFARKIPKIR